MLFVSLEPDILRFPARQSTLKEFDPQNFPVRVDARSPQVSLAVTPRGDKLWPCNSIQFQQIQGLECCPI
jgi:hypothetical protein